MSRQTRTLMGALLGGALALTGGTQAAAGPPAWGGPPTLESTPLVDDPVSFMCGDRLIEFTGGELVSRDRSLPNGDYRDVRRPVDATAVDQFGNEYRVHGVGTLFIDGDTGQQQFRLVGAVVGAAGMTYTLNSRFVFDGPSVTADERGTCTATFG